MSNFDNVFVDLVVAIGRVTPVCRSQDTDPETLPAL